MILLILYNGVAAMIAFAFVWAVSMVRERHPDFLVDTTFRRNEDKQYVWCVFTAILWPIIAPIAFGILLAKMKI